MNDDDVFRLLLLGCGLVFMPLGLYRRVRSYTGEQLDRWQEGVFILFGLRLSGLMVFAAMLAWMINPAWMAWSSLPIPLWLRWSGLALAVLAGTLWVWAVHHLGKNLTDTVVTRQDHSLVTTGPYRWIRHPFYTACALGFISAALISANWFILLTACIAWFVFLVPRTRIEEANLFERFGDEYLHFKDTTGRFLPRLGRRHSGSSKAV